MENLEVNFYYCFDGYHVVAVKNSESKKKDNQNRVYEIFKKSLDRSERPEDLLTELCKNNDGSFYINYFDDKNRNLMDKTMSDFLSRTKLSDHPVIVLMLLEEDEKVVENGVDLPYEKTALENYVRATVSLGFESSNHSYKGEQLEEYAEVLVNSRKAT